MTTRFILSVAVGCLACSDAAHSPPRAQSGDAASPSPVSEALRRTREREGKNLVAAAEAMPAGKYGFKPTPAQMSFGDVIVHLSGGNDFLCSAVAGETAPKRAEIKVDAGKDKLVERLRESFQYCETALAKADDSKLTGMVPWFGGRQVTRAQAVLATAQDWADHYSQLAIYLRLNGLLPPTAKQKEE
jgi:DinB family protein